MEVLNLGCAFLHLIDGGDPWLHYEQRVGAEFSASIGLMRPLWRPGQQRSSQQSSHAAVFSMSLCKAKRSC
eukprot:scaffold490046_cov13-Prasinocladus_malaysianus.AAC.1